MPYIMKKLSKAKTKMFTLRNKTEENRILPNNQKNYCFQLFNPFHATSFFWYHVKTSESQRFSDVFRGYQKRPVALNRLKGLRNGTVIIW